MAAVVPVGVAGADNSRRLRHRRRRGLRGRHHARRHREPRRRVAEFEISVNGFFTCSSDGDGEPALVALDLDQNPDTGSAFYGTEVELAPDDDRRRHTSTAPTTGTSAAFRGSGRPRLADAATVVGYYSIDTAQLGLKPGERLQRRRRHARPHGRHGSRPAHLQLRAGSGDEPPALGPDRRAPHVIAYASAGVSRQTSGPPRTGRSSGRGRDCAEVRCACSRGDGFCGRSRRRYGARIPSASRR